MLNGIVKFRNKVAGHSLVMFSGVTFNPDDPHVERVGLECPDGKAVMSTVCLLSVATEEEGLAVAEAAIVATMNRLAYLHNIPIGDSELERYKFVDSGPGSAMIALGDSVAMFSSGHSEDELRGVPVDELTRWLAQRTVKGEQSFGLFRSAMRSTGPIERYLTLYGVLSALFKNQREIDKFITNVEPSVPTTPDPRNPGVQETIYTRLRNELNHPRERKASLQDTRKEIDDVLPKLVDLVKQAVERMD